jgi:hypothetical protein
MEACDATVRHVLEQRALTAQEEALLQAAVRRLVRKSRHGDLKPSNIGVFLDRQGFISKCLFIDCANVKPVADSFERAWEQYLHRARRFAKTENLATF